MNYPKPNEYSDLPLGIEKAFRYTSVVGVPFLFYTGLINLYIYLVKLAKGDSSGGIVFSLAVVIGLGLTIPYIVIIEAYHKVVQKYLDKSLRDVAHRPTLIGLFFHRMSKIIRLFIAYFIKKMELNISHMETDLQMLEAKQKSVNKK